ncbi:hypothetical protein O6H91_22G066200 [Diphasiastrum complanatum]|uniref:Uncharacterized protein n=2 Tax=Diphasiastrum complanatum TaxID=34168 RepID=A0ACC2AGF4_DIPCM|nr:hypothetical protein O6H91_22G066200 [Diphasiastrum complanatum]
MDLSSLPLNWRMDDIMEMDDESEELKALEASLASLLRKLGAVITDAKHVEVVISALYQLASLLHPTPYQLPSSYSTTTGLTSLEELAVECRTKALSASNNMNTSEILSHVFYGGSLFAAFSKLLLLYVAPDWLSCFPVSAQKCLLDNFFTLAPPREALLVLVPTLTRNYSTIESANNDYNFSCSQAERLLMQCLIQQPGIKQMAVSYMSPAVESEYSMSTITSRSNSKQTTQYNMSHVAQLISSIPDRVRADAPSALQSPAFFHSVTAQLLLAAREHWEHIPSTLSVNIEQTRDGNFVFIEEVFAKICRRGHADIISSEVVLTLLQDMPQKVKEDDLTCPNVSAQNLCRLGSNFWSSLIASMKDDPHTLQRWTEALLLDMAQRNLLDSEASYILSTLYGDSVSKSKNIREMFTEQFLFWKVLPIRCLKWVLNLSVICSPKPLEHGTELKPSFFNIQKDVVRHIAEVWTKKSFIRSATMEQQTYLTAALVMCLGAVTKEEVNNTDSLLQYLLEGISARLESPLPQVRRMAKQVALAFSVIIDPSNPLLLDDEDDIDNLKDLEDHKTEGVKKTKLKASVASFGSVGDEVSRSGEIRNKFPSQNGEQQHEPVACDDVDETGLKQARIRRKERKERLALEEDDPDAIVNLAAITYNSGSDEDSEDSMETYNESESSLQPYDMSDDDADLERAKFPSQLSQCAADLRKGDNPDAVEKALDVIEKLVKARPDELENSAVDLAHALVHVRCSSIAVEGQEGSAEQKRQQALLTLLVCSPLATAMVLTKELFSPHVDVSQRMLILDVLADAAQELSTTGGPMDSEDHISRDQVTELSWAPNAMPWYGPGGSHRRGAGPWKEVSSLDTGNTFLSWSHRYERELPPLPGQKRLGKSRKWGHRSMELRQEKRDITQIGKSSRRNKFAPFAASFMLPVMHEYDKRTHGVDLLGRDFIVLGRLIHMLGVCMESIALQPEAPVLGAAVLDMLRSQAIANHLESYVRRSALYAATRVIISLHPSAVVNALKGGDAVLVSGLEWIREWALHIADHDTDTECSMMAMACVQLHAEMALQAKRTLDSIQSHVHQNRGILLNDELSIVLPFNVVL